MFQFLKMDGHNTCHCNGQEHRPIFLRLMVQLSHIRCIKPKFMGQVAPRLHAVGLAYELGNSQQELRQILEVPTVVANCKCEFGQRLWRCTVNLCIHFFQTLALTAS